MRKEYLSNHKTVDEPKTEIETKYRIAKRVNELMGFIDELTEIEH